MIEYAYIQYYRHNWYFTIASGKETIVYSTGIVCDPILSLLTVLGKLSIKRWELVGTVSYRDKYILRRNKDV